MIDTTAGRRSSSRQMRISVTGASRDRCGSLIIVHQTHFKCNNDVLLLDMRGVRPFYRAYLRRRYFGSFEQRFWPRALAFVRSPVTRAARGPQLVTQALVR